VKDREADDEQWSQLALEAARGHSPSLRQLVLYLLPRVRNLVRYLVRGDRDVDDLSQDALLAILQGLPSYRGDGAFRSWADRVVVRRVFATRKAPAHRLESVTDPTQLELEPAAPLPDRYYIRRELVAELDALPPAQRDTLVLHYVLGMTVPEISVEFGVPDETVRSRLRLGRQRLRERLTRDSRPVGARRVE
jgi:RNA polymerase sigma-70 factor (ECF subfamily)